MTKNQKQHLSYCTPHFHDVTFPRNEEPLEYLTFQKVPAQGLVLPNRTGFFMGVKPTANSGDALPPICFEYEFDATSMV